MALDPGPAPRDRADILDYREATKLKNTYVDNLPGEVNPDTGRVHTSFQQLMTATGRLQSSGPNLQNIPIRTEQGKEIRRAFIAGDRTVSSSRPITHRSSSGSWPR